jgi:hypothetical protein
MKNFFIKVTACALFLQLTACQKAKDYSATTELPVFVEHTILSGAHYSDHSAFIETEYSQLKFLVRFDSTAMYTTTDPANQYDINKLYGFSDNNAGHHDFSARIGWRWSDGALRLFAYVYNNGNVAYQELTTVSIGEVHECSIFATEGRYIFIADDKTISLPRVSEGNVAKGYKLFPYFGGDETAPHDIHIWIKEK